MHHTTGGVSWIVKIGIVGFGLRGQLALEEAHRPGAGSASIAVCDVAERGSRRRGAAAFPEALVTDIPR